MYTIFSLDEDPVQQHKAMPSTPEFLEFVNAGIKDNIAKIPALQQKRESLSIYNPEVKCKITFNTGHAKYMNINPDLGTNNNYFLFSIEVMQYATEPTEGNWKSYYITLRVQKYDYVPPTIVEGVVSYTKDSMLYVSVRNKEIFGCLTDHIKLLYELDELRMLDEY